MTEIVHYDEKAAIALATARTELAAATARAIASGSVVLPPHAREPGAAAAIMLAGLELGLQPMEAIRSLHLVDGRVVLAADAQLALVLRRGVALEWIRTDATAAECRIVRPGRQPHAVAYTIQDAQRAGLAGRQTWQRHPAAMLRARCITTAIRQYCPDLLSGAYSPDEAADFGASPAPAAAAPPVVAEYSDPPAPAPRKGPTNAELIALRDQALAVGVSADRLAALKEAAGGDRGALATSIREAIADATAPEPGSDFGVEDEPRE